jgi:hypothetical protein
VHGGRTPCRAGCGDRRGSQSNRDFAHHDSHSIVLSIPAFPKSNSAVPNELRRAAQSLGVVALRVLAVRVLALRSEPKKIEVDRFFRLTDGSHTADVRVHGIVAVTLLPTMFAK